MTNRLVIGGDPGLYGALAFLADGAFAGFVDVPRARRKHGGFEVDGAALADAVRPILTAHAGAYVVAAIESVSAMRGWGSATTFKFGDSVGVIRGVMGAFGIGYVRVMPKRWKAWAGAGKDKADALRVARAKFPTAAPQLARMKDNGRADALLIAMWAHQTDQIARAA